MSTRMLTAMPEETVDAAAQALARVRSAGSGRQRKSSTVPASRYSSSAADDRDPGLLGRALDDWAKRQGFTDRLAVTGLLNRWVDIVGPQVAEHVSVAEFRPADGGTVALVADSQSWALQMRYLKDQVLARISDELGPGLVARITISGPAEKRVGAGKLRVRHGRRSPRTGDSHQQNLLEGPPDAR